ncbi:uncharacterized protein LOC128731971 [Anopheles nili]|uniref:uncharacterized protein LOC128731971 n=1 Tax=Anopheles nili TaxID=185578 RepID=UPI00237C1FE0|nr:uncharacterized protein LOC128731971 [Anopheles nili]
MARFVAYLVLVVVLLIERTLAGAIPNNVPNGDSPCPNIFRYEKDNVKQQIYGVVDTRDQPVHNTATLELHFSIHAELHTKYLGSIEVMEDKAKISDQFRNQRGVTYRVNFPIQDPLPKLKKITLNGQVLCSGPGDAGSIVTSVTLSHFIRADQCQGSCDHTRILPASPSYDLKPPARVNPTVAPVVALPKPKEPTVSTSIIQSESPAIQHEYQRTIERTEETSNPQDNSTSVKYIREEITYRKQIISPGGATSLPLGELEVPSFVRDKLT